MSIHHLLMTLLLVTSGCSGIELRIPRGQLQSDLARRFPIVRDKHVVLVEASEPQIEFPGSPDTLGLRLRLRALSHSGKSELGGSTRVEGRLEYVPGEHAFYLRDPVVTHLAFDAPRGDGLLATTVGDMNNAWLVRASRALVETFLQTHPIYRLDAARSPKEAKAIRHMRDAHIDGDDLVLVVDL